MNNIKNVLDCIPVNWEKDNLYNSSIFNLSEREKIEKKTLKTLRDYLEIKIDSKIYQYIEKNYISKDIKDIIPCIFPNSGIPEIPTILDCETSYINMITSQICTEMIVLLRYNEYNTVLSISIIDIDDNEETNYNFNFERNIFNDIAIFFIASVLPILGIGELHPVYAICNAIND